jgi:DNA-binding XRE family transcriptional regulator
MKKVTVDSSSINSKGSAQRAKKYAWEGSEHNPKVVFATRVIHSSFQKSPPNDAMIIRVLRAVMGLTNERLSALTGVSSNSLSQMANGSRRINWKTAKRLRLVIRIYLKTSDGPLWQRKVLAEIARYLEERT